MNTTIELVAGLPRDDLLKRLYFHNRQGEISQRALGYYLLEMHRRGEFRPGFRSAAHWAEEKLSLKRGDRLVFIAKQLEELPVIDGAFSRGEVAWTKVREMARVATKNTEGKWLDFALKRSSRALEEAVARARQGDEPGDGLGTRRPQSWVRIPLSAKDRLLWDTALRKLMEELGKGSTPSDALKAMAEMVIRMDPEGNIPGRKERSASAYTVVYLQTEDGKSAWVETEEGRVAVSPETVAEKVREGARVIHARDLEGVGECRAVRFGERGEVAKEERDDPVLPEIKVAVLARDGHRCVVCRGRKNLAVHHLDSHAHGGRGLMERLCTLCEDCHALVHDHLIVLRVEADGRVVALNKNREPIHGETSAAEALEEVETLEKVEPEKVDSEKVAEPSDALEALEKDELPAELSARDWRRLGGRLEWSASAEAYDFHPEREVLEEVESPERDSQTARGASDLPATRPVTFEDFVGQRRVVENLLLRAQAREARGETLGHVLLSGPAGLGKTTLARLLAERSGTRFEEVLAGHLADVDQLLSLLVRLEKGDVLFLDEIHRLKSPLEECLYTAMEDGFVDVVVRERSSARRIRLRLEAFTLVGATTRLGVLSEPFRARFGVKETLEPYSEKDLCEVVERASVRWGTPASPEAAEEVARRSRGTPREAIRMLEWARDIAEIELSKNKDLGKFLDHVVQVFHVQAAAERLGIDEHGLLREERATLALLIEREKPMGLEAMASRLGLELQTLKDVHEPWLERSGLTERTPRGRVATEKARLYYGPRRSGPERWGIPILKIRWASG